MNELTKTKIKKPRFITPLNMIHTRILIVKKRNFFTIQINITGNILRKFWYKNSLNFSFRKKKSETFYLLVVSRLTCSCNMNLQMR